MRDVVAISVSFSKTTRDKKEDFNCNFTAIQRTEKIVARRSVGFLFRNSHRLFVEILFTHLFISFHGGKVAMSTRKKEKLIAVHKITATDKKNVDKNVSEFSTNKSSIK